MPHQTRLALAERIVDAVGALALRHFEARAALTVDSKAPLDFVSLADRQAETLARQMLEEHFPGEAIQGEEQGGAATGSRWIIDPIDGTTNFLSGLPIWAVSLAYRADDGTGVSAIALPALGQRLSVASGQGLARMASSVALAGIGRNPGWAGPARLALEARLEAAGFSLVSLGSCAASLALVAAGRLSGYAEMGVKPWDVAAGELLCREAGLEVRLVERNETTIDIIAGTTQFVRAISQQEP